MEGSEGGEYPLAAEGEPACIQLQGELGGAQCKQSDQRSVLPGLNDAVFFAADPVHSLVIKADKGYHIIDTGLTEDGCYQAGFGPGTRIE